MIKKIFNTYSNILSSILLIIMGILFFFRGKHVLLAINIINIIYLSIKVISNIYALFFSKEKTIDKVISLLTTSILLLIVAFRFNWVIEIIITFIGWFIIINAIIHIIDAYRCRKDMIHGTLNYTVKALTEVILGNILIINRHHNGYYLSALIGLYFIIYGAATLVEKLKDYLPAKSLSFVKNHNSFPLPVIISAIIPQTFYMSVDNFYKQEQLSFSQTPENEEPVDLEVLIYLKQDGPESLGHIDISYKGFIFSYGCHDPHHRHLMGTFGDGVLIIADRNKFIKQAISEKKMVISYGIKLSDKEKTILEKRIIEITSRIYPWACDAKADPTKEAKDYASRVYQATDAKMYKFTKGKFKTYFVFSTNCVLLSDQLIRCKELNLINISGIIVPGSYLKFLNEEYLRKNSIVHRRIIYRQ